jgi:AraC-like DNA-binding protein
MLAGLLLGIVHDRELLREAQGESGDPPPGRGYPPGAERRIGRASRARYMTLETIAPMSDDPLSAFRHSPADIPALAGDMVTTPPVTPARGHDRIAGWSRGMRSHYTTGNLERNDRYSFWHEVVCKQFVTADSVKKCKGSFDAELTCNQLGRTQVSRFEAPSHQWKRNRKHIRADNEDVYLLGVFREGEGALEQNGNRAIQREGSIVLYDTALPFTFDLSATINILTLPRPILDSRLPHARQLLARTLECDPGLTPILCEMIDSLLDLNVETRKFSMVRERLADSLLDIILAIFDLNSASLSSENAANPSMEKMLAYARANLGDPELSPADIAKFGSVSPRTMNRLFAKFGTTPMRWVLQERVRLGEIYLREGCAKTVTEATFMAGFNDISHFSRSFKHLLGYSPERILGRD